MTDWAEQMVNSGPWGAHHTTSARPPAMRSAQIEATRLWETAGPQRRTQLLESGGPGVGTAWTMRPDAREIWLNRVQWRQATQLRLGLWSDDDDPRCRHTNRDKETCDRPIGRGPQHALDCKSSPSRIKLRNSMSNAWTAAKTGSRCGGRVCGTRAEQMVVRDGRMERP